LANVFSYHDYRTYLQDFYVEQKRLKRGFTVRQFSKKAGVKSPNYLTLVMHGDRNLSQGIATKFVAALGLNKIESRYFHTLVEIQHEKDDSQKIVLEDQLNQIKYSGRRQVLKNCVEEFLGDWIHAAIREMAVLKDFRADPHWIKKRLKEEVDVERIQSALNFLLETGFLRRQDDRYMLADPVLGTTDEVSSSAIRSHHRQLIDLARKSIDRDAMEDREMGAVTLSLPKQQLTQLKGELKQFRKMINEKYGSQSELPLNSEIVQLNFQLFKLTEIGN